MKSIDELRNETPGATRVMHFNNCGSALPPAAVVNAQIEHLLLERDVGGYEAAASNERKRTVYSAAAALLGCRSDEIAFASSASCAWNGFVDSLALRPDDEILTSRIECGTNLSALRQLAMRTGAAPKILASRPDGTVDLDDLARRLGRRTKLVAVSHAAAHFGGVNPVKDIGKLVAGTGAIFLVDACQSLGQIPVNVDAIACDALTASGRKWLRGPRGTGFLYVRRGASEKMGLGAEGIIAQELDPDNDWISTGDEITSDARRLELWERNVASEIGLAVAIEYLLEIGVEAAHHRIAGLAARVVERLQPVPGVSVLATGTIGSGIVGLSFSGGARAVAYVKDYLHKRAVNVSGMGYYDAPLDCAARKIRSILRVAPHYYNTEEEIEELCEHLAAGLRAADRI
jgi:cysteine desulfurase / selenocysteine lyase